MNNTRRGFIASLLALLSLPRNVNASSDILDNNGYKQAKSVFGQKGSTVGKIVFYNNTGMTARMIIDQSITPSTPTYFFSYVNAGGQIEATGTPNYTTALGALDLLPPNGLIQALSVQFPAINTTATYYLNYDGTKTFVSATKVDPPLMS